MFLILFYIFDVFIFCFLLSCFASFFVMSDFTFILRIDSTRITLTVMNRSLKRVLKLNLDRNQYENCIAIDRMKIKIKSKL